jgi:restriction endonuclease S subunit
MTRLLKDIAAIRSGYLFRGRIEAHANGRYRVIQIGDLAADSIIRPRTLTRTDLPDVKNSHLIEKGDVLFISRGSRKQAVAITEDLENAITTSQIFVIRPDSSTLPEYFAWYLNQRPAQRYIEEHSTGTNVSLINLDAFGKTPVQTPPIEIQRRIAQIHSLTLREKELMQSIQARRHSLIESMLLRKIGL